MASKGKRAAPPDYQKLWRTYSKWMKEDADWYEGEKNRTAARLAAQGQLEGSDIWKNEMGRIESEYDKKKETLRGSATYKILSSNLQYAMSKNELVKTLKPGWKEVERKMGWKTVKGYERIDGKKSSYPATTGWNMGMGNNFVMGGTQNSNILGLGGRGPLSVTGGPAYSPTSNNIDRLNANENDPFKYSTKNLSVEDFYTKQYGGYDGKGPGKDKTQGPIERGVPQGIERQEARGAGRHAELDAQMKEWLTQGAWLVDSERTWLGA